VRESSPIRPFPFQFFCMSVRSWSAGPSESLCFFPGWTRPTARLPPFLVGLSSCGSCLRLVASPSRPFSGPEHPAFSPRWKTAVYYLYSFTLAAADSSFSSLLSRTLAQSLCVQSFLSLFSSLLPHISMGALSPPLSCLCRARPLFLDPAR